MKFRTLCLLSVFFFFSFLPQQKKKITVWMIGDSTMSIKSPRAYPETGWGMAFVYYWDSTVKIENLAMNGRSTRTFRDEGRWEPVMKKISAGDYVFIQFGHNDEVPTKKSYVTEKDFHDNLARYVKETQARGGKPVLLTSIARRKFDSTGTIVETHATYAAITRKLAEELNVPLIDIGETSKQLLQEMGPERSKLLYNHLAPGEHPNYPDGKADDTHFSELGARKMAELVIREIKNQHLELAERICRPR